MSVKYSKTRIQGFVKDYLHRHVYMKVKVYFVKLSESENYKSDVIESKVTKMRMTDPEPKLNLQRLNLPDLHTILKNLSQDSFKYLEINPKTEIRQF